MLHYSINIYTNLSSVFHYWKDPSKYFTTGEKAVWKNLAAWAFDDNEWVDLPGPAEWWPEDEGLDATGFQFSDQKYGHKEAWLMVMGDKEPEDGSYNRVFPAEDDLLIMEDNSMSRMALKAFAELSSSKMRF
jgi:hypothetical protein